MPKREAFEQFAVAGSALFKHMEGFSTYQRREVRKQKLPHVNRRKTWLDKGQCQWTTVSHSRIRRSCREVMPRIVEMGVLSSTEFEYKFDSKTNEKLEKELLYDAGQ